MRSLLFVPAHKRELYDKAVRSATDAIVFDLEDACPAPRKAEALELVQEWARAAYTGDTGKEFFVRVNSPLDAFLLDADPFTGLVIPKLRSAGQLRDYPTMPALAIIETPQAVENVAEIAFDPYVRGLIFGTADLAAAMGMPPDPYGGYYFEELRYARARMLWAAKAAGKLAIDGVCLDIYEHQSSIADWQVAFEAGFDGAVALTPAQATVVNEVFTPSANHVAWARNVLAFEESGEARVLPGGTVCGAPTFKQARAILRRAGLEG